MMIGMPSQLLFFHVTFYPRRLLDIDLLVLSNVVETLQFSNHRFISKIVILALMIVCMESCINNGNGKS